MEVHFNEIESLTEQTMEARLKKLQQMNLKRNRALIRH